VYANRDIKNFRGELFCKTATLNACERKRGRIKVEFGEIFCERESWNKLVFSGVKVSRFAVGCGKMKESTLQITEFTEFRIF
jgi:hypothetical protein